MKSSNLVLLQDGEQGWMLFERPVRILSSHSPAEVLPILRSVDRAVSKGLYAAGFLSYEAASGLDPVLAVKHSNFLPLAWFGLFRAVKRLKCLPDVTGSYKISEWQSDLSSREYKASIARIKSRIHEGATYQTDFTFQLRSRFRGDPYALFCDIVNAQQSNYCGIIEADEWAVCSASPELFFERDGECIRSRPMKGTMPRGVNEAQDVERTRTLVASEKDRAENVMIVDMIRNDLARIAKPGSVKMTRLYDVERYPTVLQMTSTVEARTRAGLAETMTALFPCASVTGAPKVETMKIIRQLERGPRGIYCGSIGWIGPRNKACFNVAIRTATIQRKTGKASYGVGSGIVWDSNAGSEFQECLDKARVLTVKRPSFSLLETILWTRAQGYKLLPEHLDRLDSSGRYFSYAVSRKAVKARLERQALRFSAPAMRVRLTVKRDGKLAIQAVPVQIGPCRWRVGLALTPVDSQDCFLYHKTTHRVVYERARSERPELDDVLLFNERGELTESTIANLVLVIGGRHYTPPVSSGLLAGTYRQRLLKSGRLHERVLSVKDLKKAERIYLINSVRGRIEVEFN